MMKKGEGLIFLLYSLIIYRDTVCMESIPIFFIVTLLLLFHIFRRCHPELALETLSEIGHAAESRHIGNF